MDVRDTSENKWYYWNRNLLNCYIGLKFLWECYIIHTFRPKRRLYRSRVEFVSSKISTKFADFCTSPLLLTSPRRSLRWHCRKVSSWWFPHSLPLRYFADVYRNIEFLNLVLFMVTVFLRFEMQRLWTPLFNNFDNQFQYMDTIQSDFLS